MPSKKAAVADPDKDLDDSSSRGGSAAPDGGAEGEGKRSS